MIVNVSPVVNPSTTLPLGRKNNNKQHLNKDMTIDSDTPAQEQYVTTTLGRIFTFLIGRENGNSEESEGSPLEQICLT